MKGIVFKELISMMEDTFGEETTEEVLNSVQLESEGAYTSVGYYDHKEILAIVTALAEKTKTPGNVLVKAFGRHMLDTFYNAHPDYFKRPSCIDFIRSIDEYIHVEVKKLNPDAELPNLTFVEENGQTELHYKSKRPFADLAEGLLERCLEVFNDNLTLEVPERENSNERKFIFVQNG